MDNPSCPLCPGVGKYLGALGNLAHFQCQSCGTPFHEDVDEPDVDEAPESAGFYDERTSDFEYPSQRRFDR